MYFGKGEKKLKSWTEGLRFLGRLAGIVFGAVISAYSIQAFIVHAGLAGGGIGGIALLLYYTLRWPIGIMTLILNIPLFVLGWREVSKRFILKTLVGLATFTVFLDLFKGIKPLPIDDLLLAALYGGVVGGIGGGIVFRFGGSLGGTDIVAKVIQRKFGWGMGTTSLFFNVFIILAAWAILGPKTVLYTLVYMFTYSRTIDAVISGIPAKSVMIVSGRAEEVAERILQDVKRGATFLHGQGAYSDREKEIIMCVVSLPEVGRLKQVVREVDPEAFMIVQNASEVLGRGFVPNE